MASPPTLMIRNPLLRYLLLSSVLLSPSISSSGGLMTVAAGRKVGGRSEVSDVDSNEEVQDLGHFAVREYNRQAQDDRHRGQQLAFSKVVAAQTQVASGIIYYLRVEADVVPEDGNAAAEDRRRPFDAVVAVRPWLGTRALVSFAPSADVGDRPRRGVKPTTVLVMPARRRNN